MAPAETTRSSSVATDDDNEQSKPLLGEQDSVRDGEDDGEQGPLSWSSSHNRAAKLAEYLPTTTHPSFMHRVLRGLYGQLRAADVPRIFWVSLAIENQRCSACVSRDVRYLLTTNCPSEVSLPYCTIFTVLFALQ